MEARVYAEQRQIRLIGVDRPGIGSSTPYQYDTVFAFADDLRTIADPLGIDQFEVIGLSGGGPYTLACAAAMPALAWKRIALRCVAVPTPAEAKFMAPGFALAAVTKSFTVLNSFDGGTTRTLGIMPSGITATRSLAGSYASFG